MEFCVQVEPEFDIRPIFKAICIFLQDADAEQQLEANRRAQVAQEELKAHWGNLSILELNELKAASTPAQITPVASQYQDQLKLVLSQYEQLGPKPKLILLGRGAQTEELSAEDRQRLALIRTFINTSQQFVSIRVCQMICNVPHCSRCGYVFDQNCGDTVSICPQCRMFQNVTYRRTIHDMDDAPALVEEDSQDLTNYLDTARAYQGLTRPNFPPDFHEKINAYLSSKLYPTTQDIRAHPSKYPLQKDLTRKGTPRSVMYSAIKECCSQPSRFYRFINVICHEIWDWGLPQFEDLMETLREEYQISQPVYRRIVAGHKNSSLNAQLRLYVDLWRHRDRLGFELKQSNFKIPDTSSIKEENAQAWNATCRELKWDSPFIAKPQTVTLGRRLPPKKKKMKIDS